MKLIPIVCMLLLITGCWDRKEINDLAIIMATGIDQKKDNVTEISVQVFLPKESAGGQGMGGTDGSGGGGGSGQTMVVSALGESIGDAIAHLQEKLPRQTFWGHDEVFIFGEQRAKAGITDDIDFLIRARQPRERASVFVSEGPAIDTLRLMPSLERNSAETLREIARSHTGLEISLKDISNMLFQEMNAAVLPYIVILPPEPNKPPENTNAVIYGCAVFKKGKMVGNIDNRVTRGILWLRNEIKNSIFTVYLQDEKGSISLRMVNGAAKITPQIKGNTWHIAVDIETDDNVLQNTTNQDLMDPNVVKEVERITNKEIEARVRTAIDQLQKGMNADIIGFSEAFHRHYPKQWNRVKNKWDEQFPKIEIQITSHSRIRRPGNVSKKPMQGGDRG
ncbi:Spore germination protein B3 precursor [compost metagenome]